MIKDNYMHVYAYMLSVILSILVLQMACYYIAMNEGDWYTYRDYTVCKSSIAITVVYIYFKVFIQII